MKFRPPSVPLITVDPFFSVWSPSDALYSAPTEHWSGKLCPIFAGVYIGNTFYSVAGFDEDGKALNRRIYQRSLAVTPTSTVYKFENELVELELTFLAPLLLNKTEVMTRPVNYVSYKINNKCDKTARFVFGISTRAAVNNRSQRVMIKKTAYSICAGNVCQSPLSQSGDSVMIDWGYLHLCDKDAFVGRIADQGGNIEALPINNTYSPYADGAYLMTVKGESEGVVTLAYDEIKPIMYFGEELDECYTRYFRDFGEMVSAAVREYPEIKALSEKFDAELIEEASRFGEDYKNIVSLAYRQAVSAHKMVYDREGKILFLSKENASNGCIGTLDVTYPSIPLFLKYAPELVKGMLRPIIKYALSDEWKYDFPPHDVGRYPIANGQVYGADKLTFLGGADGGAGFIGKQNDECQMPVEEAGNMLISLAAVKKYSGGDVSLFEENKELMRTWVEYLVRYGYDPQNQLCTDDFMGHLARNCNLSLKAIMGIAAYADLSGDASYMELAREYANRWEQDAKAEHLGTRLTFDTPDGWSLKYNVVWDNLLGYRLFSDEMKKKEIELYKSKLNSYGVPLDNRSDLTKIDWLVWSSRIYDDGEYHKEICKGIVDMINETLDRVPLTDLYFTSTADWYIFRARSVVGGIFINLI